VPLLSAHDSPEVASPQPPLTGDSWQVESVPLVSRGSQDEQVAGAVTEHPDRQPENELAALVQRLDQYRAIATAALIDLQWEEASTRLLPATDLTIAGIVKHLAWAEDRWFQGRLLGAEMPTPWDVLNRRDSLLLQPGEQTWRSRCFQWEFGGTGSSQMTHGSPPEARPSV